MKTTVELSDDLYRRAKSEAALRGRKLKDLVEERTTAARRTQSSERTDTLQADALSLLECLAVTHRWPWIRFS
jgi:hypothetical protein